MTQIIELPISTKPLSTAYMYLAYPLCILDGVGYGDWTASRYLRLFSWQASPIERGSDTNDRVVLDFIDAFSYRRSGLLEEELLGYSDLNGGGRITHQLEGWLDAGYYVTVFLDEALLHAPDPPDVMFHEVLVHGLDRDRDRVLAVAFDDSQGLPMFGKVEYPLASFEAAINSGLHWLEGEGASHIGPIIQLLRPARPSTGFDAAGAIAELRAHYDRRPTELEHFHAEQRWWSPGPYPVNVRTNFGADSLIHLTNHFGRVSGESEQFDYRLVHLVCDHHTAVVRTVDRLFHEHRTGLPPAIAAQLAGVSQRLRTLRTVCLGAALGSGRPPVRPDELLSIAELQEATVRTALDLLS